MEKQMRIIVGDNSGLFSVSCANAFCLHGCWTLLRPQNRDSLIEAIRTEHPDLLVLEPFSASLDLEQMVSEIRQITDIGIAAAVLRSSPAMYRPFCKDDIFFVQTEGDSTEFAEKVLTHFHFNVQKCAHEPTEQEREMNITKLLQRCGISPNLSGYHYMRLAVTMAYDLTGGKFVMTRLYESIACEMSSTPIRVERAIRHALVVAWVQNPSVWHHVFSVHGERHISNSEFIALAVELLRMDEIMRCSVSSS